MARTTRRRLLAASPALLAAVPPLSASDAPCRHVELHARYFGLDDRLAALAQISQRDQRVDHLFEQQIAAMRALAEAEACGVECLRLQAEVFRDYAGRLANGREGEASPLPIDPHGGWLEQWRQASAEGHRLWGDTLEMPPEAKPYWEQMHELDRLITETPAGTAEGMAAKLRWLAADSEDFTDGMVDPGRAKAIVAQVAAFLDG